MTITRKRALGTSPIRVRTVTDDPRKVTPGSRRHPRIRSCVAALAMLVAGLCAHDARADLIVPAGAQYALSSGLTDLACTDVVVAGTLQVQSGSLVNVRHLTILSGGSVDGGSGSIELGGNWSNAGSFAGGTGTVRFSDLCGLSSASIAGSSVYANAGFVTSTGKSYVFAVGSTQTITGVLEIAGTAGLPIQFRSGAPGLTGFVNLAAGGVQQIQHVGVTDVWATGLWLAPFLSNEGGGGNANRWFGVPGGAGAHGIPALADAALLGLSALLLFLGVRSSRRRAAARAAPGRTSSGSTS
jgi:hypothetical protein